MSMNKNLRAIFLFLLSFILLLVSCGTPPATPSPTATPTQVLDVKVDTTASGPQIVRHSPMDGERLALAGSISVVFDREMDQDKTASAWSLFDTVGKPIAGKILWKDARTLVFQPSNKLRPSTTYTGALATIALAKDGTSPAAVSKLIFQTVDALTVSQVFPADSTENVQVGSNITVIFNRPVVPVKIKEEQSGLPQPLTISPEVKGQGEWLNSSVYIFQPDEPLASGVQYHLSVPAELADISGNPLASEYVWDFNTQAPEIGHFSLLNGEQDPSYEPSMVALDQAFVVDFLQPMSPESVAAALTLRNRETAQPFPFKLKWNDDFTQLIIEPQGRYAIASFYELNLTPKARSKSGGTLRNGMNVRFSTVPLPSIQSVFPAPKARQTNFNASMSIEFSSRMNFDSLKNKIKITPALEKEPTLYYDEYSRQLYVSGLAPDTNYVVRIAPGMADIYGNTIKNEYSWSFTTGKLTPSAQMLVSWSPMVYRKSSTQEFFFEHTNIDSATFAIYQITPEEFTKQAMAPTLNVPKGKLIREWSPDLRQIENKRVRDRVGLADIAGEPLPSGYYLIGLKAYPLKFYGAFHQTALFAVATDNVTLKTTSTEALAWVVDLEKGLPVADVPVVIYNDTQREIGRAKTDKNGLVYIKDLKNPYMAALDDDQHVGLASNNWGSGVSPYDFGIWDSYYSAENTLPFGYIYTERPLYRPNQEVFFKGIVRNNDDLHYSLPAQNKIYIAILNSNGEKVYAEALELSKLGTFAGSLNLAENASLGSYTITASTKNDDESVFTISSFRVAEYHKPEFQVNVTASPNNLLVDEKITFGLDMSYYSGGGVANAKVQWFTQSTPYFFNPSEKYNGFSFMDWDRDTYFGPPSPNGNGILSEGEDSTDEQGHLELTEIASLGQSTVSQVVTFNANVTDVGGNLVSGNTNVVVHQSLLYAGIRSEEYIGKQGEEQSFEVVALDWESNPLANQSMTVDFVEREWLSVQEQDDQGMLRWVSSVKETPIKNNVAVVTDGEGKAKVSFAPPKGGTYKAIVTVKDEQGHIHQASTYIWVTSNDYISWRQTNNRSFNLIPDKDSYKPGETAEIMIAQPFQNDVYALVTSERGHIYQKEVLLLKGNSNVYKLPITKEMAPASYISVVVVSGAQDSQAPDFKVGLIRINVNTDEQNLDISVSADKKAAGPGSDVTYTIETKNNQGKPVPAEVSLSVVDKAVLALAPSNTGPILNAFYADPGLSITTSVGIVLNAEDFNANYEESVTDGESAGGGGKGEGDLGIITVRQNFKDTAYYTAQLMTDENGQAKVTVTLPENLTTWQADVYGVTEDTLVGQATSELVSTKMLFIEMQTPRFFVAGDEAQVGAVIHNNSDAPLTASVSLDAEGVELKSAAAQSVTVPARQQEYVTWNLTVRQGVRRVDFTAHANSGALSDSSKPALGTLPDQGLPVYSYSVPETVGSAGLLSDANSVTEAVQLPQTLGSGDSILSVEVAPSLAASMKDGLTFLQDYQYLCVEQTVSRFLPNVVSSHALKLAGGPSLTLQSQLDSNVSTALQRLYAKQLSDGGWGWWDAHTSDPQTSAYVVLGLIEAKAAGYTISDNVLSRAVQYLRDNVISVGANEPAWKHNRQAFILYVLSRQGSKPQTGLIFEHRHALSIYGKAYLAQAIYNIDPTDKRLDTLMADLASSAVLSAAGAHWEEKETDTWNWNTNLRTTAIVLDTFIKVDPKNSVTANAVRWLMTNRSSNHWGSTQETAWTLMALTNWLVASKEYETNYPYAIGLNGNKLQDNIASKDNLTETTRLNIGLKDLLADEANYLVLTRGNGTGNLYYSAYLTTTLPVEDVKPLDQGMVVSRQYFSPSDPKTPITEAKRGDLVRVRLTVVLPNDAHYIVVDDPLPAGFEALDANIATDMAAPTAYTRQDFDERGWGWWYFSHVEVRDEKVVLSTDFLPAGTYVYTYLARASTVGTFKVIPPHAAEFYFPDVGGRGAGSIFTVK